MRQLIAGNWKMHGLSAQAVQLATAIRAGSASSHCDLLLFPPSTHLHQVAACVAGSAVMVGGQDCHSASAGPHTGDISAAMLRDCGATWTLVGHSERRRDHCETDAVVRAKACAAAAAGLRPIVCVGENEAQHAAGQAHAVVAAQLAGSIPQGFAGEIAYEPAWAIGTGRIPAASWIADMHGFIRENLIGALGSAAGAIRILYGGSVSPDNADAILTLERVGGALIGGASLKAKSFLQIAQAARLPD